MVSPMSDLDDMLREYLTREREDPIRKRLENQAEWMLKHEREDSGRHAELMLVINGHGFRLTTLEGKATALEEDVEITGQHNIDALRLKARRIDDAVFKAVMIAVIALLGGGIVEFIHRAAGH